MKKFCLKKKGRVFEGYGCTRLPKLPLSQPFRAGTTWLFFILAWTWFTRKLITLKRIFCHDVLFDYSTANVVYHPQIDFGSLKKVTRVATKGGTNIAFYVSKFKLEYSNNTRNWTSYRDNEVSRYHSQPQGLLSLLAGEAWARAGPGAQALPAKRVRRSWGRQQRTSTESEPFSLFDATKFVLLSVFSLTWMIQICPNICSISRGPRVQKSSSGWLASLKNVAA